MDVSSAPTATSSRAPSPPNPNHPAPLSRTETLTAVSTRDHETKPIPATEKTTTDVESVSVDESKLLTGRKLFLVFVGFLLSVLLIALDQTIVATALPRIASDFDALDQLTWIVSAYFLTQAGLMLTYGQFLTIAKTKYLYLLAISIFELGSLICGVSPNLHLLIFGRAVQGVGASGIFISVLTVISQVTRLEDRPALFGSFGGVFALASVVGPLLGGAFTDHVTWRWCFYINLPFGAISVAAVAIWLPAHDPVESPMHKGMTQWQKWKSLDWLGSVLSLGTITPLLLALQWGGQSKAWNDKAVIACFAVFGAVLILFIGWEHYMGPRAMMPLRMFKRRTQVGASGEAFFLMFIFIASTYYLPFFYQSKGRTPTQSGIDIIAFMLAAVVGTAGSGAIINKTGRYWPFLFLGPLVAAPAGGLLFTIDVNTSGAKLIGYQILLGIGTGVAFQNTIISIQAEYADEPETIPQATSLVTFLQLVGGTVGIAISGTVFGVRLRANLAQYANIIPDDVLRAVQQSVSVIFTLPKDLQEPVVNAYVAALDYTFVIIVPAAGLASLFALLIRNYNLHERSGPGASAGMA